MKDTYSRGYKAAALVLLLIELAVLLPACFWRLHSFSAAQRILAARKSITAYSRSAAASDMPGHQSVFTFKNTNITYC